jgi:phosphatidyl-myo-inositol dimannoside synthase
MNDVSFALWAPQMAASGGVQSYMWRLWEMLQHARKHGLTTTAGVTLTDSTDALARWPNPTSRRPIGAGGSRPRFVLLSLGRHNRANFVIVGHINQSPVAWFAKYLGVINDYVVVLHGIEAWHRASWLKRHAMMHARVIIATTRFTATMCAKVNELPSSKFSVIPLCAEPRPDEPASGFELDGDWPILFVARLSKTERYKGLDTLIEAVTELQREGMSIKLHVIGDGDDRDRLEALAGSLMPRSDGVAFHGRVDGPTLQAAYRSAKTFAMPSAKEGFGIVFLEAMRHGVPCIGGAHGGTPEVFEDGIEGLLVQYQQTDALKALLRRLVQSPEDAHNLGEAGRERFMRDYICEGKLGSWW